tara:strand:- start:1892 stop:2398 length:507 start_codon:yes stop_codon:yes gene_type:complete
LKKHTLNHKIRSNQIRLIDSNGEMVGIFSKNEALKKAEDKDLDLVEMNNNGKESVCKIMDYSKYLYEQKKKLKEQKKAQKKHESKEIKFRPVTEKHDLETKVNHVIEFIEDGHEVKLTVMLRGREQAHPELAFDMLNDVLIQINAQTKYQLKQKPNKQGRNVLAIITP